MNMNMPYILSLLDCSYLLHAFALWLSLLLNSNVPYSQAIPNYGTSFCLTCSTSSSREKRIIFLLLTTLPRDTFKAGHVDAAQDSTDKQHQQHSSACWSNTHTFPREAATFPSEEQSQACRGDPTDTLGDNCKIRFR